MTIRITRALLLHRAIWRALSTRVPNDIVRSLVNAVHVNERAMVPIERKCVEAWLNIETGGKQPVVEDWSTRL